MILGKIWGDTECLLDTPLLSVHSLFIKPNMTCSMHAHEFKWNGFYTTKGRLFIEVRKKAYNLVDVTEIGPGQLTSVRPGEFHRFVTRDEPFEGIEFYYLEPLSEDIVRESVGGPLKPAAAPVSATGCECGRHDTQLLCDCPLGQPFRLKTRSP